MSEILSSKEVLTRVGHVCFGCGRKFDSKTKMKRESIADCGTVFTCYLCETCSDICSDMEYGDEFGFSELREEALEREGAKIE